MKGRSTIYPERASFRDKIREDIDEALLDNPKSMEELLCLLEIKEYEIKQGKYPTIRGKGQKRFVRLQSLGEGYTQENLENRIQKADGIPVKRKKSHRDTTVKKEFDLLIDIQKKLQQGKGTGYAKWATVYNIKQIAQTLLFLQEKDVRDYESLDEKIDEVTTRFHELSEDIKATEKRLHEIATLKINILNYIKTRDVYVAYRKAGYSKMFLEEHREEITLHQAAKKVFNELQIVQLPKVKELSEEHGKVLAKKKELYAEYRQVKNEMQEYVTAKHIIDTFLGSCEKDKSVPETKK